MTFRCGKSLADGCQRGVKKMPLLSVSIYFGSVVDMSGIADFNGREGSTLQAEVFLESGSGVGVVIPSSSSPTRSSAIPCKLFYKHLPVQII